MDWSRVIRGVEHGAMLLLGAAVAAVGFCLTPYAKKHRHLTARRRT